MASWLTPPGKWVLFSRDASETIQPIVVRCSSLVAKNVQCMCALAPPLIEGLTLGNVVIRADLSSS